MRVPTKVSVSNQRPALIQQEARAPAIAQGVEFFDSIKKLTGELQGYAKEQESFDLNNIYVKETGDLARDFEEKKSTDTDPYGFSLRTTGDYEKRHKDLIETLRASKRFSAESLRDLDTSLAKVRNGYVVPALQWEKASIASSNDVKLDELGTSFSQEAAARPENVDQILQGAEGAVNDAPGFDAIQRADRVAKLKKQVTMAAGFGFATRSPVDTIKLLTGRDPYDPVGEAAPAVPVSLTVEGLRPHFVAQESGGDYTVKNTETGALGRYQVMPDTGKSLAKKAGLPWRPELMTKGTPEAKAYQDKIGDAAIQDAIDHSGGDPAAAFSYYYSGSATAYKNPAGNPKTAKYVEDMQKRVGAVPAAVATEAAVVDQVKSPDAPDGKTGIPALDHLDTSERMQVLNVARTEFNRVQVQERANVEVRHDNAVAAAMNGEEPKGAPTAEEYNRAYGPVMGPQKFAELRESKEVGVFVANLKTKSTPTIAAELEALKPKDPASPTYAVELAAYQKAQQAASTIIDARKQDPAGYVISQYPGVAEAWEGATDASGRRKAYASMQAAYEKLGTPALERVPMTKEQAATMREQMKTLSPEAKLETIKSWRSEMGNLFGPGMRQLSETGMVVETYLANLMLANPQTSGMSANVLRGLRVVEENKALAPNERDANAAFVRAIPQATQLRLAPDEIDGVRRAAIGLYVLDGNDPKNISPNKFQEYVREALGGTRGNAHTGWFSEGKRGVNYQTILPSGISDNQFLRWKEGLTVNDFRRLGGDIPVDTNHRPIPISEIVEKGVFVKRGRNHYEIIMSPTGHAVVKDNGQPYIMIITPNQVGKHF